MAVKDCIRPAFLRPKDKVAIVSPAGAVDPALIDGACATLISWGLVPVVGAYAKGKYGRYAGSDEQRLFDLQQAMDDPSIAAILCGRGGYGALRIVDKLCFKGFAQRPKWLIGFSDITTLHSRFEKEGFASIHGVMAKALAHQSDNKKAVTSLKNMLFGKEVSYKVTKGKKYNRAGVATGELVGGNLSLLYALTGTPYAVRPEGKILFIEDLSERMYHIDRMVQNLRLSGIFDGIKGLVLGQFADIEPDRSMNQTLEEIFLAAVGDRDIPIAFGFPFGHVTDNRALMHGAPVELKVREEGAELSFIG
ncbi:MAG: LD-carboxypeptidase [Paludibacteraceae bacterium]|nr:LD-carboxypeptidase [Paludibacteraceae bacterium]